jgi:hypothetical protein
VGFNLPRPANINKLNNLTETREEFLRYALAEEAWRDSSPEDRDDLYLAAARLRKESIKKLTQPTLNKLPMRTTTIHKQRPITRQDWANHRQSWRDQAMTLAYCAATGNEPARETLLAMADLADQQEKLNAEAEEGSNLP